MRKMNDKAVTPIVAVIIVLGLVLVGGYVAMTQGWITIPETQEATIAATQGCITFDITPSEGNSTQPMRLNADNDGFSTGYLANTTQHDIYYWDNVTQWTDPYMIFQCEPIPPTGWETTQTITLYYAITNPDEKPADVSGEYYILTKSGGNRMATFTGDGNTEYEHGSRSLTSTGNETVVLFLYTDEDALSRVEDEGDYGLTLKFWTEDIYGNVCWSESFDIDFEMQATGTTTTNFTPGTW